MKRPHPVIARLARERLKAGVSVSEMSRRLFVARRTLRERETGEHEPTSLADVDRWAAVFGLKLALVPIEKRQRDLGEAS